MTPDRDPPRPPRWLDRLYERLAPGPRREEMVGDLREEYARRVSGGEARWRANLWALGELASPDMLRLRWRGGGMAKMTMGVGQEVGQVARGLTRRPGYAAVVIVSLALGIGALTSAYSLAYGVLMRPLPFTQPDRLVQLWVATEDGRTRRELSLPDFRRVRDEVDALASVAALTRVRMVVPDPDAAARLRGEAVTPDYLELLGVRPALGRGFDPAEARGAGAAVVLIAHRVWQERFGGDPSVVGRLLRSSNEAYQIVGVMPPDFGGTTDEDVIDFWVPLERWYAAERPDRPDFLDAPDAAVVRVVGRLATGSELPGAGSELEAVGARLADQRSSGDVFRGLWVEPLAESWRSRARPGLLALLAAAAGLLLIGCFNVTSLQVVRASRRGRELAVRAALGAGRGRIVRLVFLEMALLSVVGGAAGLALAEGLTGFLSTTLLGLSQWVQLPVYVTVEPGAAALFCGASVTLGVMLAVGLVGGMLSVRQTGAGRLREGGRGTGGGSTSLTGPAMVVAEVAVALTLLVAAGLMLRSYGYLTRVDPGFRTDVLALQVTLNPRSYDDGVSREEYRREAVRRLESLPGVQGVAVAAPALPVLSFLQVTVGSPDGGVSSPEMLLEADAHQVNAEFFRSLGIELLSGAVPASAWERGEDRLAVVSRGLAEALWGDEPAVGRRLRLGGAPGDWDDATVAAVAEDVMWLGPRSRRRRSADLYLPVAADPPGFFGVAVLASSGPGAVAAEARRAVQGIDPATPVHWVESMADRLHGRARGPGSQAAVVTLFSSVALIMALVGIYGVMAFQVERRRGEFGVRMALGARPWSIVHSVLLRAAAVTGAGLAAGLVLSLLATRLMTTLLYGIPSLDAVTFVTVPGAFLTVALLAATVPALRAARTDPMQVLKIE